MQEKDLLTVKEYAEAAGVSQQAVYQRLNKGLSSFVVEVKGQKFIKRQALEEAQGQKDSSKVEQDSSKDSSKVEQGLNNVDKLLETLSQTVTLLQGQLEVKDQQISELNKRLEQALNNTSQSHYIAAQAQHKQIAEPEPEEFTPDNAEEEKQQPRSFFARIFGR